MRGRLAAGFALLFLCLGAIAQPIAQLIGQPTTQLSNQSSENPGQATAHSGKAIKLMQERRYREAAAEFEKSLAANPDDDSIRIQYATCLFAQERNAEARKQFELEAQRLGSQPGFNYFLGQLDLRANDYASAIRRLQPLSANSAFPKASLYLGLAYMSNGETTRALESLQLAAKNNPEDPEVHYRLGRVYTTVGRTDDADREFEIYRKNREIQRIVEEDGHACLDALHSQPIAEARQACQKIADPKDSRRMLLLGELYADSGQFADAVEPLRIAVTLDPSSFDGWHNLGRSLFALKQYRSAVPALQKAAALNPQYFDTLNLLAASYHLLNDDESALPILERAHALNPSDANLTAALEKMRAASRAKR